MTGIRLDAEGIITHKVFGCIDKDMIEVSDFYQGRVGDKYSELNSEGIKEQVVEEVPDLNSPVYEELNSLLSYLYSTDWYALRKLETGKEIPEEVLVKREDCRLQISTLRMQLKET